MSDNQQAAEEKKPLDMRIMAALMFGVENKPKPDELNTKIPLDSWDDTVLNDEGRRKSSDDQ